MSNENEEEQTNTQETFEVSCKKNLINVVYSMKPLYLIQPCFGIFPFRIHNGQLYPPSWKMKILMVWIMLAFCVLFFSSRCDKLSEITNFVNAMEQVPGIVMLTQYLTSVITSFFIADTTYINILTAIAELDTLLHVEAINDFYKKSHTETIHYLIILSFIHALNCIGDFATAGGFTLLVFGGLPLYFFQKLQTFAFQKWILMLKYRLMLINEYLSEFIKDQNKRNTAAFTTRKAIVEIKAKYNFIGRASDGNMKIRDLASMYDHMGNITLMINEAWNNQILIILVSIFVYIVVLMWISLYYYRMPDHYSGTLANLFVWGLGAIYTVAVMSFTCEQLLQTRKETKVLVNKVIINYDLPKTMRIQAKSFMDLIEAWPLRIYAYDMFSVDITLMLKFISAATTYLIVVIQISHYF